MPVHANHKDLLLYRRLLVFAAAVYLVWWGAVELVLENDFNPLGSRLFVVGCFLLVWALSFSQRWVRRHVDTLYSICVYLLTLHFFYLFYANQGNSNWVTGSFITVLAICYCFFRVLPLLGYSLFVAILAIVLVYYLPHLQHSVFLPGIATVLLQANIGLWARRVITRQLTESNERFQLLFNSVSEGVGVHENSRIVHANDALAKMLGYKRHELIGMDLFQLIQPEMHFLTKEKIASGNTAPYESRGLRKDGSNFPIEITAKMIAYGGKHLRLVLAQDLSERKKIESERVHSLAVQENLKARDEFISLASHELKTPLTSLRLWNQMMERSFKKGPALSPERIREFIFMSGKQISRLTTLVRDMLDVSQISAGRLVLESTRVDLAPLVREAMESLKPQIDAIGAPLALHATGGYFVLGDASRLHQVVENLLTNAMKYGNGKPIELSLRHESGEVVLRVKDHGHGIAHDQRDRIFERFERVTSEKNISGLGLGLYLTKQIVQAHGGSIAVESELGVGSVFSVRLPANN